MVPRELIGELRRIVGDRHVSESRIASELYSYDGSLAKGAPGAVVFPADARETAQVVKAAARAGIPFVPRGFGTNLSGGTVLPHGGLTDLPLAPEPHPRHQPAEPHCRRPARRDQPGAAERARPPGLFLRPGPRQPEGVHAGRQRG